MKIQAKTMQKESSASIGLYIDIFLMVDKFLNNIFHVNKSRINQTKQNIKRQ